MSTPEQSPNTPQPIQIGAVQTEPEAPKLPIWTRIGALKEGFANHIGIWKEAIAAEKKRPKTTPLQKAELAFLPAALEVAETPVPPIARITALTIAAFVTITVAWASIGNLDIVAVAPGKLVPSERVKTIQPLETSIVRAIHVKEGQAVKAGDVLVELEVTGGAADVSRVASELNTAQLDIARNDALLTQDPIKSFSPPPETTPDLIRVQRSLLQSQLQEHNAKIAALEAELSKKQAELKTTEADLKRLKNVSVKILDETRRRRELAEKGYGSQIDRARSERELADNQGQFQVQTAKLSEIKASVHSVQSQISQTQEEFRRDITEHLAEARTKAASLEQDLIKAKERQRVQSLTSPVNGTVQQLAVHTLGGVVTPAQELMTVVPKSSYLEIEAKLPNKDIGFVEVGQEAEVKIDAFPFTRYGTIPAKVDFISLDAVVDEGDQSQSYYFPIRLTLTNTSIEVENGKIVPLSSGMTVSAEIKTGTRKPIEYVLSPLKKYVDETGRER